jgi:hypothetical protein
MVDLSGGSSDCRIVLDGRALSNDRAMARLGENVSVPHLFGLEGGGLFCPNLVWLDFEVVIQWFRRDAALTYLP